jgi:hypothetical protein
MSLFRKGRGELVPGFGGYVPACYRYSGEVVDLVGRYCNFIPVH